MSFVPARRAIVATVVVLAVCAWCAAVSGFHPSTMPAFVTWLISLAAVIAADVAFWRGRRGRRWGWRLQPVAEPWPRTGRGGAARAWAGTSPWLALCVVALAWDVLGLATGKHEPHLTISALTQAFRSLRAALLLAWIAAGVGYGAALARAPLRAGAKSPRPERARDAGRSFSPAAAMGLIGLHRATVPALLLGRSRALGVAFWLAVAGAAVLVDQLARASSGRLAKAEELIRFITRVPAVNVLLVVAWAYAGWHLFAHWP